ncbi:contact-dependent growth inhibition system immunity protein [Yersinia aleksiciae]|uniref:contact-dependent growth inhibition system immunity protein n=1 Tax=Yersinia aleksiciae TaxID=263819 RepID=UPI00119ED73D|nr:contact-dependent growth inhibition system immunity protein [Yersinia aleksiciae]MDN0125252.1 contact-dependent growth inhibition system immunity protein [Yersinia aleksiciae]
MTEIPNKKSWAYIKANKDFISVETYSGYWNYLPDPKGKQYQLSPISSDDELGLAVLAALAASRIINPHDEPDFFDVRGRVVPQYEAWVQSIMDKYGYKTKRTMFKEMKSCLIVREDATVTIRPSHHEKLETWSGKGITETDYVVIPENSLPAEIGAALRLAISRCTG